MPNETTDTDTGSTDSDATQDVSTGGDTAAVDLQDLVDDYREEVERLRELKERVEGDDKESGDDDEEVEWPPAEWAGVDHPIRAAKHAAELVEAEIERFGGSEFVIKKARAGEAARATDMLADGSMKNGTDPRSQIQMQEHHKVQVCVEKAPPDAPTTSDGRLNTLAFEQPTFEWLNNRVDNFNTYGEVELSDF